MMRFTRFLKIEVDVVIGRHVLAENDAIIFIHPNVAKIAGIKDGDIVEIERNGKTIKLKAKLSEIAPEKGCLIPNGIYASYLADLNGFKRFKANIELSDGDVTKVEEILEKLKKS